MMWRRPHIRNCASGVYLIECVITSVRRPMTCSRVSSAVRMSTCPVPCILPPSQVCSRRSSDRLASIAGMSTSAFHQHFRAVTSMTPLQFQKQLRLMESRRLMLSEGRSASRAAFTVGYLSVSQFNRDYRRMFGLPPVRETAKARKTAERKSSDRSGFVRRDAVGFRAPVISA